MAIAEGAHIGHGDIGIVTGGCDNTVRKDYGRLLEVGDLQYLMAVIGLISGVYNGPDGFSWTIPGMGMSLYGTDGGTAVFDYHPPSENAATPPDAARLTGLLSSVHMQLSERYFDRVLMYETMDLGGDRNLLYTGLYWDDLADENGYLIMPLRGERCGEFNGHLSSIRAQAKGAKREMGSLGRVVMHGDFQRKNLWLSDGEGREVVIGDWDGIRTGIAWAEIIWLAMTESYQKGSPPEYDQDIFGQVLGNAVKIMDADPGLRRYWNPVPSAGLAKTLWGINCLRASLTAHYRMSRLRSSTGGFQQQKKLYNLNLDILNWLAEGGHEFIRGAYMKSPGLSEIAATEKPLAVGLGF